MSGADIIDLFNSQQDDPEMDMLRQLIEKLFGGKINGFHMASPQRCPSPGNIVTPATSPHPAKVGWGARYSRSETYSETQNTSFQANGVIKTADGKEIKFDLKMEMQRQYSTGDQTRISLGDAKNADPLVVNFGGTSTQLSDKQFAFDLTGKTPGEKINFVTAGSGFLVLDKNGNGKIDDGGEMFGPATGNGFGELASYDKTGKGWIDSANPVFDKLKVWTKNEDGTDKLTGLSELGIGAISTNAIATPFDIKTADNALKGAVRSTGIFLREDGTAGAVQQVDLTV
jgi:hypothetical protein